MMGGGACAVLVLYNTHHALYFAPSWCSATHRSTPDCGNTYAALVLIDRPMQWSANALFSNPIISTTSSITPSPLASTTTPAPIHSPHQERPTPNVGKQSASQYALSECAQ